MTTSCLGIQHKSDNCRRRRWRRAYELYIGYIPDDMQSRTCTRGFKAFCILLCITLLWILLCVYYELPGRPTFLTGIQHNWGYSSGVEHNANASSYLETSVSVSGVTPTMRTSKDVEIGANGTKYLLQSTKCRIPWFSPYDKTVTKYSRNDYVRCKPVHPILTYQDGTVLRLYHDVIKKHYSNFTGCIYIPIVRKNMSDTGYTLLETRTTKFVNDTEIKDEFVKVTCYNSTSIVHTDYYAFVLPKNISLTENHEQPKEKFNVLLLGFESISRNSFVRALPKLRALLMNLDAVELKVHSVVGANTFPNMLGVLGGISVTDLGLQGWARSQSFDKFDFLWDHYRRAGYRTLWAEDGAYGGSFNYLLKGFKKIPTDYYYRPFTAAYARDKNARPNSHCIGDRYEVSVMLKYISDFIKMCKERHFFSFGFSCRNTHDHARFINMLEDPNLKFFENVLNSILNTTVILVFADHGQRISGIRLTTAGRLEAKLPAMYIILPPKLKEKHPRLVKNLKANAHKLTSQFDIHRTLLHLLNLSDSSKFAGDKKVKGRSLFDEIPSERSCYDAGINIPFCPCGEIIKLNTSIPHVKKAAEFSVTFLNTEIKEVRNVCHNISLVKVRSAHNLTLQSLNTTQYLLQIQTHPGDAIFEFIVKHTIEGFSMEGKPSRINKYEGQSYCVEDKYLQTICYCSELYKQKLK
ncbi:hypothetical protein ScPMuIL_008010 [Solemya velum]